jgi:hypothetical protein
MRNKDRIIQLYIQCHSIIVYFLQLPSVVLPQTAKYTWFIQEKFLLFGVSSRCAQVINKTGERFSQAQEYIMQLYNCRKILIVFILGHVSTLLSHLQVPNPEND